MAKELQYYKEKYREETRRTERLEEMNTRQEQRNKDELEGTKSQLKDANGRLNAYQEQLHETNQMLEKYKDYVGEIQGLCWRNTRW